MYWIAAAITAAAALHSARKQKDFERSMSNTSYQRAVKDMVKAGLNPMLAYQQGGASTPSVSAISPFEGLSQSLTAKKKVEKVDVPLAESAAEKNRADAGLSRVQADKAAQDKLTSAADERLKNQLAKESVTRSGFSAAQTKRELARLSEESVKSRMFQGIGALQEDVAAGLSKLKSLDFGEFLPGRQKRTWKLMPENQGKVTSGQDLKRKMEAAERIKRLNEQEGGE